MELKYKYRGYTLIDITKTNITSYSAEKEKERNQQRNWETAQQVLSLRANLIDFQFLGTTKEDLKGYSFGINYRGSHKIWHFNFEVEQDLVYAKGIDRYGLLKDDFRVSPIILGLDETAEPEVALFFPDGAYKNIYFIAQATD
jgi:hypothetical protein